MSDTLRDSIQNYTTPGIFRVRALSGLLCGLLFQQGKEATHLEELLRVQGGQDAPDLGEGGGVGLAGVEKGLRRDAAVKADIKECIHGGERASRRNFLNIAWILAQV